MSYRIETRYGGVRSIISDDERATDVNIDEGFAYVKGTNGMTYACYIDDILMRSEGELGRVCIPQTIKTLESKLAQISQIELEKFIESVSEDRGIHSGRLELTLKYGHPSYNELAWKILAHHFAIGDEALTGLLGNNIFRNMPENQAVGFKKRLMREGRLEKKPIGSLKDLKPNSTHLLSNKKILFIK